MVLVVVEELVEVKRRWRWRCDGAGSLRIAPAEISFEPQDKRSRLPVVSRKKAAHEAIGWRAGFSKHAVIEYPRPTPDVSGVNA